MIRYYQQCTFLPFHNSLNLSIISQNFILDSCSNNAQSALSVLFQVIFYLHVSEKKQSLCLYMAGLYCCLLLSGAYNIITGAPYAVDTKQVR